jgi:hypothetical protein
MIVAKSTPLVMYEVTDPEELAKAEAQRKRFRKNSDWLQAHIPEVYSQHRGRCICVAGQELFVADTGPEVVALARKAHPEDDGFLLRYIPKEKMERIYGHLRAVGEL